MHVHIYIYIYIYTHNYFAADQVAAVVEVGVPSVHDLHEEVAPLMDTVVL